MRLGPSKSGLCECPFFSLMVEVILESRPDAPARTVKPGRCESPFFSLMVEVVLESRHDAPARTEGLPSLCPPCAAADVERFSSTGLYYSTLLSVLGVVSSYSNKMTFADAWFCSRCRCRTSGSMSCKMCFRRAD